MADLRTALGAIGRGELAVEIVAERLQTLLARAPRLAGEVRALLDDAHRRGELDDAALGTLRAVVDGASPAAADPTDPGAATRFAADAGGVERAADEATVFTPPPPARDGDTAPPGPSGGGQRAVDLDLGDPSGSTDAGSAWTAHSGESWRPTAGTADNVVIGPGTVLKERFELLEVLGVGGMGTVYKAVDLLKKEARDRNPYVALKVLNEDFRQHPDAFIALQREASRQQKLAHPNIATVHDFDRTGSTVFITMELMVGTPLNELIKRRVKPASGLPFAEAWHIIEGLGRGLAYAHERGMVHSDFKPGNCFLLDDGSVKVLDFGIARAVRNPQHGDAEKTLFDPARLGALTPAYASLEMLEGMDPDPRDDIYALACVAYELLTGSHPFRKLPANRAREHGLEPAPVKGLRRSQQRGLMRGLAFTRAERSQSVEQFLHELSGGASWYRNPWILGTAAAVLVAVAAIPSGLDRLHRMRIEALVTQLCQGTGATLEARLADVDALPEDDRQRVRGEECVRNTVVAHYDRRIEAAISADGFPAAATMVNRLAALFPDSASVVAVRRRVDEARTRRLGALAERLNAVLERGALLPDPQGDDLVDVRDELATVAPGHPLLDDPRIASAFSRAATGALDAGDVARARTLVTAGLQVAPDSPGLLDARDRVARAEQDARRQVRVAALEAELAALPGGSLSLDDVRRIAPVATELATLAPDSAALSALEQRALPTLGAALDRAIGGADWDALERLTGELGGLLYRVGLGETLRGLEQRLRDTAPEAAATLARQRQHAIAEVEGRTRQLLEAQRIDGDWEQRATAAVSSLGSLLDENDPRLTRLRQRVGTRLVAEAQALRDARRYAEAGRLLALAGRLAPGLEGLENAQRALAALREAFEREQRAAVEAAQVEGLKQTFLAQARALRPDPARATLQRLAELLPDDDPFLATTAPRTLAPAYLQAAQAAAGRGDPERALALVQAGLDIAPEDPALRQARREYSAAGDAAALERVIGRDPQLDATALRPRLENVRRLAPARYTELAARWAEALASQLEAMRTEDARAYNALLEQATALFPDHPRLAALRPVALKKEWGPSRYAGLIVADIEQGRLSAAREKLATAEREEAGHPQLLTARARLDAQLREARVVYGEFQKRRRTYESRGYQRGNARDLAAARRDLAVAGEVLGQVEALWADSDAVRGARRWLNDQLAHWNQWVPLASPQPCEPTLAGHGRRRRGTCYDLVHFKARGPYMVVVPAGDGIEKPYAIGKFELTWADWNKYCKLSRRCQPATDRDLKMPVTGITIDDARAYAEWLSQRTGARYRLPTALEWEHAARADGQGRRNSYNCRLEQGGQLIRGQGAMAVNAGRPNGWGLYHSVGNVQEWVRDGERIVARGGSWHDSYTQCDVALGHPHDGHADDATGVRLVRELG